MFQKFTADRGGMGLEGPPSNNSNDSFYLYSFVTERILSFSE